MGIVWDRRYFHNNDLQQCIADSCTFHKKPVLNIVDAYRAMKSNGPQGRGASDVETLKSLILSPDIVAADVAALRLFNQMFAQAGDKLPEEQVGHIDKGYMLNLGNKNLDGLKIKRIKM
jgi:uncharacterized protein (DUF362 family)